MTNEKMAIIDLIMNEAEEHLREAKYEYSHYGRTNWYEKEMAKVSTLMTCIRKIACVKGGTCSYDDNGIYIIINDVKVYRSNECFKKDMRTLSNEGRR